jgi:U4/U6 small nuclear ribonucleoprotein SNU13
MTFAITKTLNRRVADIVDVPYIYVPNKVAIGTACGISRSVILASITSNESNTLNAQIKALHDQVERLQI